MTLKDKVETGIADYINSSNAKPQLLILHPAFINELAREIQGENPFNIAELSDYFGLRIIASTDVNTEEVIPAR